ncbi:hypothetical protein P7C73_g754, partial [Tremellales sp. Uapishka_1]
MRRRTLQPLSGALTGHRDLAAKRHGHGDEGVWARLDRVQVLGDQYEGHTGCVNALSWSDDGSILLSGSDDQRSVPRVLSRRVQLTGRQDMHVGHIAALDSGIVSAPPRTAEYDPDGPRG